MIELNIKIDDEQLENTINNAEQLKDNDKVFASITEVVKAKKQIEDALEVVSKLEAKAKQDIDAKAKALYGNDWQAIAGTGYKITRSFTGAVYMINPDQRPDKKYLKVIESIDTAKVKAAIELNDGKLPKGIELNPHRNTSIRITLKG